VCACVSPMMGRHAACGNLTVPRSGAGSRLGTAQKLSFVGRNALLAAGLLATLTFSAAVTMRVVLSSRAVAVPALVGRAVRDAGLQASRQGLAVRIEGRRHDSLIPADHVLAQEPRAGSELKAHRAVRIWVSLGPQRVTVPAVEGDSARTARIALEQAGVPVARVVEIDDPATEGTVLVQRPPAGVADVAHGASLLVSRGPAGTSYVMPDLIGRDAASVVSELQAAGLKIGELRYRNYPGVAPGVVLRQAPTAGHRVDPRTPLVLDVSREAS
jgi:eukaryotic-like serine/threonine-protein kinase